MDEQIKRNTTRNFFPSLAFVLLSILGGLLVGFAFGVIGTFIYLAIIFPILLGLLGGYIVIENAKYTKTRNASLIVVTSVLTAMVIFGTIFYTRSLGLQVTTALQAFGDLSDKSLKAADVLVNYSLEKETGHSGFVGYILFKANKGVSIGRVFHSDALNLGPIFTWLYWLVELGVIAFITISMSKGISKRPFCEVCNSWYAGKRHIGGIPAAKEREILNLIKLNDCMGIGRALEENADVPSMEFYLQSCMCEKSISFLFLANVRSVNGKLTFTDILNKALTPYENKLLVSQIKSLEN